MELGEADALRCVHDRLLRTIDLREEAGKDSPTSGSCGAPATGPGLWISTWVDYTTKYGLGYLLSNGAIGVYFNDSTKIVLASDGERFEYHERAVEGAEGALSHSQAHTLSSFPHDLTKKVTLLKHFRGYLVRAWKQPCGMTPAGGPHPAHHACWSYSCMFVRFPWIPPFASFAAPTVQQAGVQVP